MSWPSITESNHLDKLIESTDDQSIVIFKHSTRCHISLMVKDRLERNFPAEKAPLYLLDLLRHRDISNEISSRFGVEHQSPQVLVIHRGKCVYHSSHNAIRPENLKEIVTGLQS